MNKLQSRQIRQSSSRPGCLRQHKNEKKKEKNQISGGNIKEIKVGRREYFISNYCVNYKNKGVIFVIKKSKFTLVQVGINNTAINSAKLASYVGPKCATLSKKIPHSTVHCTYKMISGSHVGHICS